MGIILIRQGPPFSPKKQESVAHGAHQTSHDDADSENDCDHRSRRACRRNSLPSSRQAVKVRQNRFFRGDAAGVATELQTDRRVMVEPQSKPVKAWLRTDSKPDGQCSNLERWVLRSGQ